LRSQGVHPDARSLPLGSHPHLSAIGDHLDPAILIRPHHGISLQGIDRLGARESIPVGRRYTDDHQFRTQVPQPLRRHKRGIAALGKQQHGDRSDRAAVLQRGKRIEIRTDGQEQPECIPLQQQG
jgi:hypothetical protein